jgi:hypothetical protein
MSAKATMPFGDPVTPARAYITRLRRRMKQTDVFCYISIA